MRIAPEGRPFIAAGAVILGALLVLGGALGGGWWVAAGLWLPVALWIPAFFRDPVREGPRGPHLVIAPADGKVVSVDSVHEPDHLSGAALRISVFMNVFDVHVNRYPVGGRVAFREYRPGAFLNATLDKASAANERMSLGLNGPHGPVLVRQIAGLVARRIVTDHQPGYDAAQGERLGIIRFGSRVDTFLPPDARPAVRVGDRVRAGETIIAEWHA